jgi:hypothetical protein
MPPPSGEPSAHAAHCSLARQQNEALPHARLRCIQSQHLVVDLDGDKSEHPPGQSQMRLASTGT